MEWAYLEWMLSLERPVFGLLKSAFGFLLLDRSGLLVAHKHMRVADWPKIDVLSRFALKQSPERRRAESTLRKVALARATKRGLMRMMQRHFPQGAVYFNTGHSNLSRRVLGGLSQIKTIQSVALVHDTIPLDYPELQRPGTVEPFQQKMRNLSDYADALICNSHQTKQDIERHFGAMGRVPTTIVAHLGVDVPRVMRPSDPAEPYVITLGTIEPRKNHALLLDIWEGWTEAPHLLICGRRGWNNEEVFARLDAAHARGLPITEMNDVKDDEMFTLLAGASAALFPSLAEGYGLPQIEAAALGVPLICGDLAIYREVLGDLPVYVDTSNAYSWKKAISEQLHKDSAGIARAGSNGSFFTPPSWELHFNQVLNSFG